MPPRAHFPRRRALTVAAAGLLVALPAFSPAAPPVQTTAPAETGNPAAIAPKPLFERDSPTPDPGGFREKLAERGLVFGLLYTGEGFGNPAGGRDQGAVYNGLLTGALDIEFEKLTGWKGVTFHALGYYPHGPSGTAKHVQDLNVYSNIDAYDSLRLFELWLETSLFDNVVNLRFGQLAADAEFAVTQGGALFLNSSFGALSLFALNTPAPIYPQGGPAVRLRLNSPDARFYLQAGVYSGNADADRLGDPSPGAPVGGTAYNNRGLRFPISVGNQGVFSIYEAGFLLNAGPNARGLPGAYRVGGFFHTDTFSDLRRDVDGRSLADPDSPADGRARARAGNFGVYAVADQVVYRRPGLPGGRRGDVAQSASAPVNNPADSAADAAGTEAPEGPELRVFGRVGFTPADRNLVSFYAETGFNFRGLLPNRPRDVFGAAFSYAGISGDLRGLTRDANRFNGTRDALPDFEGVLELTYQVNLTPWLSLQPDLQWIIHPGGSATFADALVLGARTVVTF